MSYRAQRMIWHLKSARGSKKSGSISVIGTHRCLYECVCVSTSILKCCFPPWGNHHIDVRALPSTSFMSEKRGKLLKRELNGKNNIQCVLKALREEEEVEEKRKLKSVCLCYAEYQKNVVILDISTALVSEDVVRQNFWNIWILDYI